MKRTRSAALATAALLAVTIPVLTAPPAQAGLTWGCSYTNSEPILRSGSTGTVVRQLQCELNDAMRNNPAIRTSDYPTAVDGAFGAKTRRMVVAIQNCRRLTPDGIVGPKTWAAINDLANQSKINPCP